MRVLRSTVAVAASALLFFGCDDDGVEPRFSGVAGDFEATRIEFVDVANPQTRTNLIDRGAAMDLELSERGTFRSRFTNTDGTIVERAGTFNIGFENGEIVFDNDPFGEVPDPTTFRFEQRGPALSFFQQDQRFDFEGDGAFETATLEMDFGRR